MKEMVIGRLSDWVEDQHFGFVTQGRLIVDVDPALAGYRPAKLYGLYQQLEQALQ